MIEYRPITLKWIAAVLLLLTGCKTHQEAVKTEYRYITEHDSVYVERFDTIRIETKGDTIRIFEKLTEREYYSTIYRDTLRQSDTLIIERTTIKEDNKKNRNKWRAWLLTGLATGITGTIIIKILIKRK